MKKGHSAKQSNNFLKICMLSAILLLTPSARTAHAQTNQQDVGAGSYEVYMGSAFYIRELMDRSQWSYVADVSDGPYWHPFGYLKGEDYGNITKEEWKTLATYWVSKRTIVEGDMLSGDNLTRDVFNINNAKGLGLKPFAVFVNRIPSDSIVNWKARIDNNRAVGVESGTMLAPHRMQELPGGFYDTSYDGNRKLILEGYGTSVDAPTHLFVNRPEKYRQSIYDVIDWTHKNNRKFMYLISPNNSHENFLEHAQTLVRMLEDNDRIPDYFGVALYGRRPYTLVPETVTDANGKKVSANTITGVAHWLLKHARADEGELDLWVKSPDGSLWGKGDVWEDLGTAAPVSFQNWKGVNGTFTFTAHLRNRSHYVDFIPTLKAQLKGLPAGWSSSFSFNGQNVTAEMLGTGYLFYKEHRLMPEQERMVTISISKAGETSLPSTLELSLQVIPHPGSRFVRDVALIRGPAFKLNTGVSGQGTVTKTPDKANYNTGEEVTLTATPGAGMVFTGWRGDATGTANPIKLTMNTNRTVNAFFTQNMPSGIEKLSIASSEVSAEQNEDHRKEFSHDGNPETRWTNDNTAENNWIIYDLGKSGVVNAVRLMLNAGETRTYPLKIEVGESRDNFTEVWSGDLPPNIGLHTIVVTEAAGQYVRMSMTGPNSNENYWFSIFQAEVWGTSSNTSVSSQAFGYTRTPTIHQLQGGFTVTAPGAPAKLELFNLQGKLLYQRSGVFENSFIPMNQNGVYFLRFSQGDSQINRKFVIQN